ncbi:SRPBCC family protein [Ferruginibacter sp.]
MTDIKHKLVINSTADNIYNAITTQQGLENWWAKQTVAKPEIGFVNVFVFGTVKNEMKISTLVPNKKVEWEIIASTGEWVGTTISFELEAKDNNKTIVRFDHNGWRAVTDLYAECNYTWARFMMSLKSYCETGTGSPS